MDNIIEALKAYRAIMVLGLADHAWEAENNPHYVPSNLEIIRMQWETVEQALADARKMQEPCVCGCLIGDVVCRGCGSKVKHE